MHPTETRKEVKKMITETGAAIPPTKQIVRAILKALPDDATLDDVVEAIYLRQRLARADRELKEGKTCTQEEVEELAKTWL